MKTSIVAFLLIAFINYDSFAQAWTTKTAFAGAGRSSAAGFALNGKGYIGTGTNGTNLADFWQFDPAGNSGAGTWTQKANLPQAMRECIGFATSTRGYMGVGGDIRTIYEYNDGDNSWTAKADLPAPGAVSSRGVGFAISNKGYFLENSSARFWEFDPVGNTWTQKAFLGGNSSLVRRGAAGFSLNGLGYVGTGLDASNNVHREFWEYNPSNDTWTEKAIYGGSARFNAVGFSVEALGKGYISLGSDAGATARELWEYDQGSNVWIKKSDFPADTRATAVGFGIDSKGYVGTGNDVGYPTAFYSYDAASESVMSVELFNFVAKADVPKEQIQLQWKTAVEVDNAEFIIEKRAVDGSFIEIGRQKGAGTRTTTTTYSMIDPQPQQGNVYYRLKQVNLNGSFGYSKIVSVSYGKGSKIKVFPTYTEGGLSIETSGFPLKNVAIFNTSGQLILRSQSNQLDISDLAKGIYFVQVQVQGEIVTEKIVKK